MPPAAKEKAKAKPKAKGEAKEAKKKKEEVEEDKKDRVQPPNKEEYNKNIQAKNTEIEKLQRDLQGVQKKIQEKNTDKDGFHDKRSMLAAKMSTYGDQIKKLNEQRTELRSQLTSKSQDQKKVTQFLKQTEQSITFRTESELDDRIHAIEIEMCTQSLTLAEEKKKVAEIQMLKKQKPKISAQAEKLDSLRAKKEELSDAKSFETLKEQITQINTRADGVWAAKEEIKNEYLALISEHKKATETSELDATRTELQKKIRGLVADRNDLRKKLQDEENAYRRAKAEEMRLAADKRNAENARRREEYEKSELQKKEEKLFVQPHLAEVALLEQTITFCKGLLPKEEKQEEKKENTAYNNPQGYAVLVKKDDRDEEMFMAATKKKGPKKQNRAAPSTVIKHDAHTFRLFDALKIKAPSSVAQVPDTLKQLQTELEKYNAKIALWEKKKEDGTLLAEFHAEAEKKAQAKRAEAGATKDDEEEASGSPTAAATKRASADKSDKASVKSARSGKSGGSNKSNK